MWILGQLFQIAGFLAVVACAIMIVWFLLALIGMFWKFILAGILVWGLWYSLIR